ncbi:MAG: nucleotide pyrophosphohydrolase [Candidatus Sericytochromatia bacterium]|nr:nucleotide pyrophosphohydrolase [Candidatus Sericytochromatia bacterium]
MTELTLGNLQDRVDGWVRAHGGYFPPLAQVARLTEELGEIARAANARWGGKTPKPGEAPVDLETEIGDLLFVLACLANQAGVRLDTAAEEALARTAGRDAGRFSDLGG